MKLYAINEQLERLLELDSERMVDTETGEILTAEEVNELIMAREEKIEGCLLFIKNKVAEAEALKAEIEKLTARMKACKNKADWTKQYVQDALQGEKFATARVAVSYGKSKSVQIACEEHQLPAEYVRTKLTVEADKTKLKKALEAGLDVPGVTLIEKQTMRIK